ncbi:hypothetical protein GCM10007977_101680 [Dactylosporangium sucinum]|uniref:Uncharacterized protein n=2 Tax=Dactylosporangium sucinum TaxID=1424081 RepID=A0A917UD44_9ACTN|nr:hypothetical protein GCM10007977_101680 [Dactylosporangium sucinum]
MIVVVAGSATLDSTPPSRAPIVAEPGPGPVVIDTPTGPPTGGPGRQSLAAVPTAPQPPGRPRASAGASGGSGGGFGVGTSTKGPQKAPSAEASPPAPVKPPAVETPASPGVPDGGVPIQDRAWPGWDATLRGRKESTVTWRRQWRSPSGSVDQAVSAGRSPDCSY